MKIFRCQVFRASACIRGGLKKSKPSLMNVRRCGLVFKKAFKSVFPCIFMFPDHRRNGQPVIEMFPLLGLNQGLSHGLAKTKDMFFVLLNQQLIFMSPSRVMRKIKKDPFNDVRTIQKDSQLKPAPSLGSKGVGVQGCHPVFTLLRSN